VVQHALCHLALAAVHSILRQPWGIAANIRALYAAGDPAEDKLVEALALVMWPAGVNRFVDACTVWHDMLRDGSITPSPRYQAWADTPGIGAFAPP
jgi:alkylhydroperoxidase/carboxymuconolactone decarboxylase family protein YurZ